MFCVTFFFTIGQNNDWSASRIVWYGSILIFVMTYLYVYDGVFILKDSGFISWFLSFMALCILSLTWSLSASTGAVVVTNLLVYLLIFMILQFSVNSGFGLDKILVCLFVSRLINVIYIIMTVDIAALGHVQLGADLIKGWNGNEIAYMAVEGALIGIYLLFEKRTISKAIFFASTIVLFTFVTVNTGSRTAFVMLLAGVILYVYIKHPTKIMRNIIITLLLLYVAFYIIMNVESIYNVLGSRFEGLFALISGEGNVDSSANIRDTYIKNGIQWFSEEPLLGYGVNNYKVLNNAAMGHPTYAHNNYIEIAVNLGIIGLVLYYSIYVVLILRLAKSLKNNSLNAFLLALLLTSLIRQYGSVCYYGLYQNLLLFLCFCATKRLKKKDEAY